MFIYTPHKNYLLKLLFAVVLIGLLVFFSVYSPMYFIMRDEHVNNYQAQSLLWSLGPNLLWFIPVFLTMFPLFKTYRYELMDDEIVVTSGYIVQKVRHVPYRMVTNLELRRGLLDRILGIGTLMVETAGNSEASGGRSEAVLSGLAEVQQVYEEVAECLRNYDLNHQAGFGARNRQVVSSNEDTPAVLHAILEELKAIREKV